MYILKRLCSNLQLLQYHLILELLNKLLKLACEFFLTLSDAFLYYLLNMVVLWQ